MVDVVDMATAEIAAFNSTALAECRKKRHLALRSHRKCAICGAVTAGDIIEANERSREVFLTPQGPVLMCPTDKVVRNMLCLIITKLGSLKMPLSPTEFNKLSAADFDFLAEKYIEMREKSNLDALGRDNQPL